ncbi:MAG: BON domain-containing protein [Planctomycetaceae bacterium]|nr:BON domain-containing protein [Planctomycetaceae bacterium]
MVAATLRSSDRQLERQIASHLAETNRPSLRRLAVNVADGNVTLRGRVTSFYEKQIAIQTCRVLAGVERLTDAVEVAAGIG